MPQDTLQLPQPINDATVRQVLQQRAEQCRLNTQLRQHLSAKEVACELGYHGFLREGAADVKKVAYRLRKLTEAGYVEEAGRYRHHRYRWITPAERAQRRKDASQRRKRERDAVKALTAMFPVDAARAARMILGDSAKVPLQMLIDLHAKIS